MRFLLMSPADTNSKAGAPPDPRLMAAIGQLTVEMTQKGVLKETGGMSAHTTRLRLSGGEVRLVDGPFAEAKEVVGGYAIIDVPSEEVAIAMARQFLEVHRDILGTDYQAESLIRRLYTPEDFGPPGARG